MPSVNLKKGRPKSYEEKLRERQERMNLVDQPSVTFMPGEDLADNEDDDDTPVEVKIKKEKEVLTLVEEDEAPLPEIELKPKPKKKKKEKIKKVASDEFAVKVGEDVKLSIKAPTKKERPSKNKMSFREKLLKQSRTNRSRY